MRNSPASMSLLATTAMRGVPFTHHICRLQLDLQAGDKNRILFPARCPSMTVGVVAASPRDVLAEAKSHAIDTRPPTGTALSSLATSCPTNSPHRASVLIASVVLRPSRAHAGRSTTIVAGQRLCWSRRFWQLAPCPQFLKSHSRFLIALGQVLLSHAFRQ